MLNIYYAGEACDKTKFIFDSIDPDQQTIILVPDQASLQMERDALEQFHKEKNDDICLDIDNDGPKRMTDEQADWFVKKSFGIERTAMVQSLPEDQQERVILSLLKAGAFMNQISRLTGISVGRIEYYRDKH